MAHEDTCLTAVQKTKRTMWTTARCTLHEGLKLPSYWERGFEFRWVPTCLRFMLSCLGVLTWQRFWHWLVPHEDTHNRMCILTFACNEYLIVIGLSCEKASIGTSTARPSLSKMCSVWTPMNVSILSRCGELITRRGLLHCAWWCNAYGIFSVLVRIVQRHSSRSTTCRAQMPVIFLQVWRTFGSSRCYRRSL